MHDLSQFGRDRQRQLHLFLCGEDKLNSKIDVPLVCLKLPPDRVLVSNTHTLTIIL